MLVFMVLTASKVRLQFLYVIQQSVKTQNKQQNHYVDLPFLLKNQPAAAK